MAFVTSVLTSLVSGSKAAETQFSAYQPEINYSQWLLGFAVVMGLIFFLAWMLKKINGQSTSGQNERMRVLSGISLGAREKVFLVDIGKRQILLGVAPGRVQTLHVLSDEEAWQPVVKEAVVDKNAFAQKLSDVLKKKGVSQ